MVQTLSRHQKPIAWLMNALFYLQFILTPVFANAESGGYRPYYSFAKRDVGFSGKPIRNVMTTANDPGINAVQVNFPESDNRPAFKIEPVGKEQTFTTGPTQPEMATFKSVNSNDLVDLFSGDFSYNIPLLDVGGYPVNLHYQSGITMDQEASWVGLGWNINPGVITRNMRGLPDDFKGGYDKVSKTLSMKPNRTFGVTGGIGFELFGWPVNFEGSFGVFHNTYKGWGTEFGLDAAISAGSGTKGKFTGRLGLNNNSQSGLDISPSIELKTDQDDLKTKGGGSIGTNYNSRTGIQELQITGEIKQTLYSDKKLGYSGYLGTKLNAGISFSKPSFTPGIRARFTSTQKTARIKFGGLKWGWLSSIFARGYMSDQRIMPEDTTREVAAFGYLNYEAAGSNYDVLLDFNREKEVAYTNNTPHIAVPIYTYDTYSISGEGTGGMFRPYRGDIGAIYDPAISNKSGSDRLAVDIGFGSLAHYGVDFTDAYSITYNNPWISSNAMYDAARFKAKDTTFENVYFKNPGEKTAVNKAYLDSIGDDKLVRVMLTPAGNDQIDPEAVATRNLALFRDGRSFDTRRITPGVLRKTREKRTQMISFLTAEEAAVAGLDKSIRAYALKSFPKGSCEGFESIPRVDQDRGRQKNHISEITVLNDDGRRYVYGIPVYNKKQIDVTMSVASGDNNTGLSSYDSSKDNSTRNDKGKDAYFNREIMPAYAHSFLLSGILSADYVDISGDGITEDDQGDAVKFNYSRPYSIASPYGWRAPFYAGKAFYNEGLKTDNRDERGSYSYGEREVWLLNSIESKTMIATFALDTINPRKDGLGVAGQNGGASMDQKLYSLKAIHLYAKADWLKSGAKAKPVKTVHFAYSYRLCKGAPGTVSDTLGKLTLDSVWFTYNGRGRAEKNAYRFKYHVANPGYDSKMADRWGVYKPASQNPGSTGGPLANADYSYSLQAGNGNWKKDSADKYAASWTLSEIKLPSGGILKVDYESDDYAWVQNKRAMQFFKLEGFGPDNTRSVDSLYASRSNGRDYSYAFVRVSEPVSTVADIKSKYLEGVEKLFFKVMVKMPEDAGNFGSGSEIIPCYAEYDEVYTVSGDPTLVCFKLRPITGNESPVVTAVLQFLRLNLPHKAFPSSEPGDNLDVRAFLGMIASVATNITNSINGFGYDARMGNICNKITSDKSFVRLNNPAYRKFGGGLRVKKVQVFDSWDKMSAGDKVAVYGQEYNYNTVVEVDGQQKVISSGVASYEPSVGNDENPFRVPSRLYIEKVGALAPTDFMYAEEPFAETFFPAASVGYSKVTVQSIHKTKKSATGISQTEFYTTKDFPTLVEITPLDRESKKTYNPRVGNFLKIDAKNYVTISQGFKVELNDMNGKVKSSVSYAQNDLKNPISYTYNYYRLEKDNATRKKLSNKVWVINDSTGVVDENGELGKEVEIMMDIREQTSVSGSGSIEANVDWVSALPPIAIGTSIPIPSKETNRFRSIAVLKVVNRYAILDSVVNIEKGSKVSTRNLVFDGETGEVLVTRTNNLFDDPLYTFNYPAHWAYSGMEAAYKNQGTVLSNLQIRRGILYKNSSPVDMDRFFESGDEILVRGNYTRDPTAPSDPCKPGYYTFTGSVSDSIVWAIHGDKGFEKEKGIYFIDRRGYPVTVNVANMKIIRSGKRNQMSVPVGSITSMANPVKEVGGVKKLVINNDTKVLNASAIRFRDIWKIEKVLKQYDSCVMEKREGSTWVSFTNSLVRRYDLTIDDTVTSYNHPLIMACFRKRGQNDTYYSRSMLRLNLQGIPQDATIDDALLSLYAKAPIGAFDIPPFGPELNFSFEGAEEATGGYIVPFTEPVAPGADVPWISDYSLNGIDGKAEMFSKTNTNTCIDYKNFQIKSAIQPLLGLHADRQNILLKLNTEDNTNGSQETRFMAFNGPNNVNAFTVSAISTSSSSQCDYEGEPPSCIDPICQSKLFVKYSYPEMACYKVCRQEYLQQDTLNPYIVGIAGNWRVDTSYVYYSNRVESAVSSTINLRKAGVIKDFEPYWQLGGKYLKPKPDITRWVWNTKSTLHNRKGFELENKDPLNRFNAALYGFNKTLPVAIAQNSRNTEIAFESFEDQEYQTNKCNLCFENGWLKLDAQNGERSQTSSHSGTSSLKVYVNKKMKMDIPVLAVPETDLPVLSVKRDSVMLIDTTFIPNGTGLTARYGVYLAGPGINTCLGQNIFGDTWWPQTDVHNVNIDYGSDGPPVFCAKNYFKVQWNGKLLIEEKDFYTFKVDGDDNVILKIDGVTIAHSGNPTGSLILSRGWHDIWVELTEEAGDSHCNIKWLRHGKQVEENLPLPVQYAQADPLAMRMDTTWCVDLKPIKKSNAITDKFSPVAGSQVLVSGWIREEKECDTSKGYKNSFIKVTCTGSDSVYTIRPSGNVIEGWQRVEKMCLIPPGTTSMKYELFAGTESAAYFDDLRIHPFRSNMKSFVYDPVSIRLMAELDENNYATYYEYDDEGTLIRVKKETERGVKTIKETRSSLLKQNIPDLSNP